MATIDDILKGTGSASGSSGGSNGDRTPTNTNSGSSKPTTTTTDVGGNVGGSVTTQQLHNTAEATDPTEAAANVAEQGVGKQKPVTVKPAVERKPLSYGEMFQALTPYSMPTKEEVESERKKEKRERLFASIGDAVSALSNLYFTTQYAPNMYDSKYSQYDAVDDRWTKLRKERDENRRRYVDGYLKAVQADDLQRIRQQNADAAQTYKESEAERKREAQAVKNAKDAAYTAWIQERAKGQGAMDEAKIKYYETKIDCLNRGMDIKEAESVAKIAEMNSRTNMNNRRGTSAWVSPSGGSSGKKGVKQSGGEFIAYDADGTERRFKTKAAAEQHAREQGTWQTDYATTTSNKYGIKTTRTSPHGGHSVKPSSPKPRTTTKTTKKTTKPSTRSGNWASRLKL